MPRLFWKWFLLLFVSLTIIPSCCSNQQFAQFKVQEQQTQLALIHHLQESSVRLVKFDSDDDFTIFCTGVWVSEFIILTAKHCAVENAELSDLHTDQSLLGSLIKIKTTHDILKSEFHWTEIIGISPDTDLAILKIIDQTPHHIATLAIKVPELGEKLIIIGHAIGILPNSLFFGYVSHSKRTLIKHTWMQIATPVTRGCSGGGGFDLEGNLVGITSGVVTQAPGIALFTDLESIRSFLEGEQIFL